MIRPLSPHPDLAQLKRQAKELCKMQQQGDPAVCAILRQLRQFANLPDVAILQAPLTLAEAQYALAMEYGFPSWQALRRQVQLINSAVTAPQLDEAAPNTAITPISISLDVIECSNYCQHCEVTHAPRGKSLSRDETMAWAKQIKREAERLGVPVEIGLKNSELLDHPEWRELCSDLGWEHFERGFLTNGRQIARDQQLIEELKERGVEWAAAHAGWWFAGNPRCVRTQTWRLRRHRHDCPHRPCRGYACRMD